MTVWPTAAEVAWSECLSVCWSWLWAVKQLSQSVCCLKHGLLMSAQGPSIKRGGDPLVGRGCFQLALSIVASFLPAFQRSFTTFSAVKLLLKNKTRRHHTDQLSSSNWFSCFTRTGRERLEIGGTCIYMRGNFLVGHPTVSNDQSTDPDHRISRAVLVFYCSAVVLVSVFFQFNFTSVSHEYFSSEFLFCC